MEENALEGGGLQMGRDGNEGAMFLVWEDLHVIQPKSSSNGNARTLLKGLTGYAEPGRIMAVMGPSGSGKTTLLDSLAGNFPVSLLISFTSLDYLGLRTSLAVSTVCTYIHSNVGTQESACVCFCTFMLSHMFMSIDNRFLLYGGHVLTFSKSTKKFDRSRATARVGSVFKYI